MTTDFKALDFSYEVQRSFANKIFSNKSVAKSFIDGNSAALLDELYKLVKIYVSLFKYFVRASSNLKLNFCTDAEQEGLRETGPQHHQDLGEVGHARAIRTLQRDGAVLAVGHPAAVAHGGHDAH
jgi:hypothetical protein